MPESLKETAHTDDGVIMGVRHKSDPVHGVQFHPESIASEHGHRILGEFPRDRPRLQRARRAEGGLTMADMKSFLAKAAARRAADARGGGGRLRHHHVGRGDADADRRLPDGAPRARRDRRRDRRRRRCDARRDDAGRGAARRDRHRRHRRRCVGHLQHLDLLRLRRRRRRRAGRQARQPRAVVEVRRRRRADGARRQDRPEAGEDRRHASARPASASCSRRTTTPRCAMSGRRGVELGTRTVFNLLGPLCNPASVKRYMLGVFAREWVEPIAECAGIARRRGGLGRAWQLRRARRASTRCRSTGTTYVAELKNGTCPPLPDRADRVRRRPGRAGGAARRHAGGERQGAARRARRRARAVPRRRRS